jgi:hypothetical protein
MVVVMFFQREAALLVGNCPIAKTPALQGSNSASRKLLTPVSFFANA